MSFRQGTRGKKYEDKGWAGSPDNKRLQGKKRRNALTDSDEGRNTTRQLLDKKPVSAPGPEGE